MSVIDQQHFIYNGIGIEIGPLYGGPPWQGPVNPQAQELAEMQQKMLEDMARKQYERQQYEAQLVAQWQAAKPVAKKPGCTCGVQHTGGIHSTWCDGDEA